MGIFLGDKPVSVYFNGTNASVPVQGVFLGGVQVFPTGTAATVPGAPVDLVGMEINCETTGCETHLLWQAPTSDGGSPITGYRVYVNDVLVESLSETETTRPGQLSASVVEVSAVNAVGEGPRSTFEIAAY